MIKNANQCDHPECIALVQMASVTCRKHWRTIPKRVRDEIWRTHEARDWAAWRAARLGALRIWYGVRT